jgi:xylulokinase
MGKYLFGIDVGTASTKGIIVHPRGEVVAESYVPHKISFPRPGWAEQDAEKTWWGDLKRVCKSLFKKVNPKDIGGVGISALCPDMLPLDKAGKPLRPAILYGIDGRASKEIKQIEEQIGKDEIFKICGNTLQAQSVGPKILWFKKHEPRLFDKTRKISSASNYLVFKLTRKWVIDKLTASMFHPLLDLSKLDWSEEMIDTLGILPDMLPEVRWSTELAGGVTTEAARETGLSKETPVIVGACDGLASFLSTGIEREGEASIFMGTTTCLAMVSDRKVTHPLLWAAPYYRSGKYLLCGGTATSGALITWFRDNFCPVKTSYSLLDKEAEGVQPGSNGLVILPYFSGERTPVLDERARGLIIGLTLSHRRSHIYRALLEATAYCIKHHFDIARKVKVLPRRIIVVDGGAKSKIWRQIISDVTNFPIEYAPKALGAPFGDAYLVGLGIGVYKNLEPLREMVSVAGVTKPREKLHKKYLKYYSIFRRLYKKTKDEMHELSEM